MHAPFAIFAGLVYHFSEGFILSPAVPIDSFFDQSVQSYFFKKRYAYWDVEKEDQSQKKGVPSGRLVRVYLNDRVQWLTYEEAKKALASLDDTDESEKAFKSSLEKALQGENTVLADEIRVTLNLAISTLQQRVDERLLEEKDIEQHTTALRRHFENAESSIEELQSTEQEITQRKTEDPVMGKYEALMAQLLIFKKQGDMARAAIIAQELQKGKKQYVLRARTLEPLKYTANYHRLDLQKIKSRVLSVQCELCELRDSVVKFELQRLKGDMSEQTDEDDLWGDLDDPIHDNETDPKVIGLRDELRSLRSEAKVAAKTVEQVDRVCQWIEDEIFQDEQLRNATFKRGEKLKKSHGSAPEKKTKSGGMAYMNKR